MELKALTGGRLDLQKLTPLPLLSTEENKAIEAWKGTRISKASDIELGQLLIYLFQLCGLNTDRYPGEIGRMVLMDFIRTNYAGNTLDEVKLAFQMAVVGKLEIDDNSHYQNFSPLYFGKIMAAYRVWSSQVHDYKLKSTPEPVQEVIEMSDVELFNASHQSYRLIRNYEFIPESVYYYAVKEGLIELDNMEKAAIKRVVMQSSENKDENNIKTLCRKMAVSRLFDRMK